MQKHKYTTERLSNRSKTGVDSISNDVNSKFLYPNKRLIIKISKEKESTQVFKTKKKDKGRNGNKIQKRQQK